MAKRKIKIFEEIHNEKEFEHMLKVHENALICAEIYCYFSGWCTALDRLFNTIKLDWSDGKMVLLKVPADEIEEFERFREQSEPVYMFILRGKATKVFRGVNNLKFAEVARQELNYFYKEREGLDFDRPMYELNQPTPDEMIWLHQMSLERQQEIATLSSIRAGRQAARKKHRAELMVPYLKMYNFVFLTERYREVVVIFTLMDHQSLILLPKIWLHQMSIERQQEIATLSSIRAGRQAARKKHRAELMIPYLKMYNFVLFWPHCIHAHHELYERWDANSIIMVGREELQLDEETARDILYAGDAPLNEASLHKLLSGPALAICFRLLDDEKHFVSLVRKILYEDLPVFEESKPLNEQAPRMTAFDYYKTLSPTRQQLWERRRQEKKRRKVKSL